MWPLVIVLAFIHRIQCATCTHWKGMLFSVSTGISQISINFKIVSYVMVDTSFIFGWNMVFLSMLHVKL